MSIPNYPQIITVCELWVKFHPEEGESFVKVFSTNTGEFQVLHDRIHKYKNDNNINHHSIEYYTSNNYLDYDY